MAVTTAIPIVRVVAPLCDRDPSPRFSDYVGKMQGAIPHPGTNNCPEKGPGIKADADREGLGTTLLYAHRFSLFFFIFDGLTQGECQTQRVESLLTGNLVLARKQYRKSEMERLLRADPLRNQIDMCGVKPCGLIAYGKCCKRLQLVARIISLDRLSDRYKLPARVDL
jgi:hypothetical protein